MVRISLEKARIINDLNKLPLWKLTIFTSNLEISILEKKKQGYSSNQSSLKNTKALRTIYRSILLKKLTEWDKDKSIECLNYSDVLNLDLTKEFIELTEGRIL